ncbi:GntR family transcriptional regulator [Lapidilactobacillus achengensis]|uniref:GntR family transcriptional regulator n=1 Tax=Lapidilactobacillus achengensis TaxID=2486000 RepID=A0ABW1UNT8_9LACO|nr:GntR family transcriptional regulator [Lapidilactobacillus achengensis]
MSKPLYLEIYKSLKSKILNGNYPAGSKLPNIATLTEEFSVSKITVEKSMKLLVDDRLITRQKGRGSFVNSDEVALINQENQTKPQKIGFIFTDFYPHYGIDLIKSILDSSSDQYEVLFALTHDQVENEKATIKKFEKENVDGIIVLPARSKYLNSELVQLVIDQFPLVFIDLSIHLDKQFSIKTDNRGAVKAVMRYILENNGPQNISIMYGSSDDIVQHERIQEIKDFCTDQSLRIPKENWISNIYSSPHSFSDNDVSNMVHVLQARPNIHTIFALNYEVAETIKYAAEKINLRIPEDLKIICFDAPKTLYGIPFFTHIQQDETEMGKKALSLLTKLINHEQIVNPTITIPTKLIVGKSFPKHI